MAESLFFVHDDPSVAEEIAAPYRASGWDVACANPSDADVLERMVEAQPLATIFCLDGCRMDAASDLAREVGSDPRCLRPLMVFLGGDTDSVARARSEVPVGLFVRPSELPWMLKHLTYKG